MSDFNRVSSPTRDPKLPEGNRRAPASSNLVAVEQETVPIDVGAIRSRTGLPIRRGSASASNSSTPQRTPTPQVGPDSTSNLQQYGTRRSQTPQYNSDQDIEDDAEEYYRSLDDSRDSRSSSRPSATQRHGAKRLPSRRNQQGRSRAPPPRTQGTSSQQTTSRDENSSDSTRPTRERPRTPSGPRRIFGFATAGLAMFRPGGSSAGTRDMEGIPLQTLNPSNRPFQMGEPSRGFPLPRVPGRQVSLAMGCGSSSNQFPWVSNQSPSIPPRTLTYRTQALEQHGAENSCMQNPAQEQPSSPPQSSNPPAPYFSESAAAFLNDVDWGHGLGDDMAFPDNDSGYDSGDENTAALPIAALQLQNMSPTWNKASTAAHLDSNQPDLEFDTPGTAAAEEQGRARRREMDEMYERRFEELEEGLRRLQDEEDEEDEGEES